MPTNALKLKHRLLQITLFAALLLLSATHQPSLSSQDAAGEGESTEKQITGDEEELPDIESRTTVAGVEYDLGPILARVESGIFQAYKLRSSGEEDKANALFAAAFGELLSARTNYHDRRTGDDEPFVRDRNHARMRVGDLSLAETWRPFLDYFNYRLSQFPRSYQRSLINKQSVSAQQALEAALRLQDDSAAQAALRSVSREYYYTDSGLRALDLLMGRAFESGDMLEVVSLAMKLKETRPEQYTRRPLRHMLLLLALESMKDADLLQAERAWAEANLADGWVSIGSKDQRFLDGLKIMREAMGFPLAPASFDLPDTLGAQVGERHQSIGLLTRSQAQRKRHVTTRYYYYRQQPEVAPKLLYTPEVGEFGVLLRRDPTTLLWKPEVDAFTRRLQLNRALRYQDFRRSDDDDEDDGNRWRRYYDVVSNPTFHRLTASVATVRSRPDRRADDQRVRSRHFAFSTFRYGKSEDKQQLMGNQIQVFDLDRDGELVITLPRLQSIEASSLMPEAEALALGNTHFTGELCVSGSKLYAVGSSCLPTSTESYLHCFDVDPASETFGFLDWRVKLSAKQGILRAWESDYAPPVESSAPMIVGRRVFVSTHSGTTSCIDAESGRPLWMVKYSLGSELTQNDFWYQSRQSNNKLFPAKPAVAGSVLVLAPADAASAFSVNAYDGHVLKPLLSRRGEYESVRFFLGLADGYAYFQRQHDAIAVPYSYRSMVRDRAADSGYKRGEPIKTASLPEELGADISRVQGLLCRDELWLASPSGVARFSRDDMSLISYQRWPDVPAIPKPPGKNATLDQRRKFDEAQRKWEDAAQVWVKDLWSLAWIEAGTAGNAFPLLMRTNCFEARLYRIDRPEPEGDQGGEDDS